MALTKQLTREEAYQKFFIHVSMYEKEMFCIYKKNDISFIHHKKDTEKIFGIPFDNMAESLYIFLYQVGAVIEEIYNDKDMINSFILNFVRVQQIKLETLIEEKEQEL